MSIPVIKVEGETIPEAWELSLIETWRNGIEIKTEYDKEGDPPSRDCTMIMVIKDPLKEPRIHLSFPGGFVDLEKYRLEVVEGVHDDWIDPESGKWTYTYHQRLFKYPIGTVDQISYIVERLSKAYYSRRAQAITWVPNFDPKTDDPPCLQRVWCRCVEEDGVLKLNMNTHWRSRDAYKAAFMNMFALTDLQRVIAERLSEKMGKKVKVGRYVDVSDSYHIYGSYFKDFRERFLKALEEKKFYDENIRLSRCISSDHPLVKKGFEAARRLIEMEKKTGLKGVYNL